MTDQLPTVHLGAIGSTSHEGNAIQRPFHVVGSPPLVDEDANAPSEGSTLSDSQSGFEAPPIPYIAPAVRFHEPRTSFRTLQKWQGVVTAVAEESFTARLIDLMSDMPEEEAEISLDEVSDDERPLVKEGAVFLLHVGYATSEGGQRSRTAILRFRRLPVWTDSELATADQVAQEQANTIRWR